VPEWMVLHTPDGVLVSIGDRGSRVDDGGGEVAGYTGGTFIDEIVVHSAVRATGGDQRGMEGVPRDSRDIFIVSAEDAEILHRAKVENATCLIAGGCRQKVAATGLEDGLGDGALVAVESCQAACSPGIPEFHKMVFRTRYNQPFGRVPVAGLNVPAVTGQCALLYALVEVPDFESAVVRCGDELCVCWRESVSRTIRWAGHIRRRRAYERSRTVSLCA